MNLHTDLPSITTSAYGSATSYNIGTSLPESYVTFAQCPSNHTNFVSNYVNQPAPTMSKRIVRVFLADADENVPLEHSILHQTAEKLTDLTDQELFFEMPVQEALAKHNAMRVTLLDKKATARSGRDTFLEPAKIRDLKMTVVSVTAF